MSSSTHHTHTGGEDPGKTLGIIGFIFVFVGLQLIGLILSAMGYNRSKRAGFSNPLALAGIILNAVFLVVGVLVFVLITVVSYNGVTTRANTNIAKANATQVQRVAETFNADNSYYPSKTTDFTGALAVSSTLSSNISLFFTGGTGDNATPSSANGSNTVWYQYCGATATPAAKDVTGGRVRSWDFSTSTLSTTIIYVGTGGASMGVGASPCHTWVTPTS